MSTREVPEEQTRGSGIDIENYDIDELFKDSHAAQEKSPYLSCILWGPEETGKTYTALTFPGPIYYLDLDGGLGPNLKYFKDKQIRHVRMISLLDNSDTLAVDDPNYDPFKVDPINTCRNFDVAVSVAQKIKGGTVVVDTISAYNEWLKDLMNVHIPKHVKEGVEYVDQFDWKYVNNKWLWAWEKLKNIEANLVVIAKAKNVYQGRDMTDELEPDLRPNTGYQTSIRIEMKKKAKTVDGKQSFVRTANFNKFRGTKLGSTYSVEDVTYDKILEILKNEDKV